MKKLSALSSSLRLGLFLLGAVASVNAAAPADENFESVTPDSGVETVATPRTVGGFVYEADGGVTTFITDKITFALTVGTGNTITINADDADPNTGTYIELHSSNLSDKFKLVSLAIESFSFGCTEAFTITGYNGGSGTTAVASDTVNLAVSDSSGSITYVKNSAAVGGILTFDPTWQNIDTIRFTKNDTNPRGPKLSLDDIDISPAVGGPTVTSANISLSGASGTGGAFKIGDTVTATWNNTVGGDNNSGVTGVTVDFSSFGGGAAVSATNSSGTWTATYTVISGAVDATNRNISVTATTASGSTTTAGTTNATVDNVAPTVTDARLSISGATGAGGVFKIGDTVTATWSNTAGGDNNADTISSVRVDFTQFGGGSAVSATNSSGTWTATYTLVSGSISATNRNVSVTATDNAGNSTTTADTTNATVDSQAPTATVATASFSADTGLSSSDFITNTAAQTISGTLSANLAAGELVEVSLDNGSTWAAATTSVGANTWSLAGQTLSGSNTLKIRVADTAGNLGATSSQAYTLDTSAPTTTIATAALSADTGLSSSDFITKTAAQTFSGTLSANLVSGETVEVSLDNGSTWSTATTSVGANTWSLSGQTLTASNTLKVRVTDTAGNAGTTYSQAYVFDTTAPTATVATAAFSADTGVSSSDFITNTAAQTLSGALSANLAAGETVEVSLDNGSTWTTASALVGQNTWSLAGQTLTASNTLKIRLVDTAGNTGTAFSQAYTLDTTAPAAPSAPDLTAGSDTGTSSTDNITSATTPTFTGTAAGNSTVTVSSNAVGSLGTTTADGAGNWSFTTGSALSAGTHTITATATDTAGNTSPVSSGLTITIAVAPNAPTIGTATAGDAQASVAFVAPASDGGTAISSYTVTANPGGATGTGSASPVTVAGLTNGTAYTFTVTATNAIGTSSASTASNSVTPKANQTITFANPGAQNFGTSPTLSATSDSGLTVTFTSSTPSVATITSGGALTFLSTGTATINADQAGDGTYSAATQVSRSFTVNAVVPGAPTVGVATAGNTQATVAFSAPAFNGGANITSYTVTSNPAGVTATGAGSPITVPGLTNGVSYTFSVTADNIAGSGPASSASNSVTPFASTNATLSALALSTGTLSPTFASGTVNYTASVSAATTSLTITPTAADTTASIKVNAVATASGNASSAIALHAGNNPITVLVTAQDGTTTATYTVTVFRPIVVTDFTDVASGGAAGTGAGAAGDLRRAILDANASGGTNIITFAGGAPATITLSGPLPPITCDLTIDGGTLGDLTIDGAGLYRAFFVDTGTVELKHLKIQNASAAGGLGGNVGGNGGGGGGGGAGLGAGLFVNQASAHVTVTDCHFVNMAAAGGNGGAAGNNAWAGGGGGGLGFGGGTSTANGGGAGGGGIQAVGANAPGLNGGDGGLGGGGAGGSYQSGSAGSPGAAYAGNSPGTAAGANGGAGGFGGGGGGSALGLPGAGGFGGGGGGTGTSTVGGSGGPGGGGGGGGLSSGTASGGTLGSSVAGGLGRRGGGGGAAAGPAIFVRGGSLTTTSSFFHNATAIGGTGGAGGSGGATFAGNNGTADATAVFNFNGTVNSSAVLGPITTALAPLSGALSPVTIASNGTDTSVAHVGQTVTLTFTASKPITTPTVTIAGHSVTPTNSSGNTWSASYTRLVSDAAGAVTFSIAFTSTDGYAGTPVTVVTDASSVAFSAMPTITSTLVASGGYGASFTPYTITATNVPTSFAATGLPSGLVIDPTTGVITGTSTQAGSFNVTLTATNGAGTSTPATLVLTIAKAALTVTANDQARGFGAADPAFTLTYSGFVNGDSSSSLTTQPVATTTATGTSGLGTYAIVPAGGVSSNYTFTYVNGTLTITQRAVAVTLVGLAQNYTGNPRAVTATTVPADVPVAITYGGSATAPTNAGTYVVSASVTDPSYQGGALGSLVVAKAAQTIAFSPIGSATVGSSVTLNAIASSGLPVTFSVVSGDATLTGASLKFNDSGAVTVRASQAGDVNHGGASVDQTIAGPAKLAQTITFGALADKKASDVSFTLAATASSGLPVAFTASGPATLSGNTVTLTGVSGSVTITAAQSGNATYQAAPVVTRTFTVSAAGMRVFIGDVVSSVGSIRQGDLAAVFPPTGNTGQLLIVAPNANLALSLGFTTGPDGSFAKTLTVPDPVAPTSSDSPRREAAPRTLTVRGLLAGNTLSGTIPELGLEFSVPEQVRGATSSSAGFYPSSTLNSATGSTNTVVGNNGEVVVLAVSGNTTVGGRTTLNADGTFTFRDTVASIAGAIDATTTTVTGTISQTGKSDILFSGANATTVRTDRLANLSSRNRVGPGARALITGFVISGAEPKRVLVRAAGPALSAFGVSTALRNPRLQLFRDGQLVQENDDWRQSANATELAATAARIGAFPFAPDSRDAAILATLSAGAYTALVVDDSGEGVGLAEIYDASETPSIDTQRLVNISTRGESGAGESVLIGGIVVSGNTPKRLLIRGVGPALASFGVSGALTDSTLKLYDSTAKLIAQNDNWETPQPLTSAQVAATGAELTDAATKAGAFAFATASRDSAIIVTLAPGSYTAHVSGAAGQTGVALIEVYELPE